MNETTSTPEEQTWIDLLARQMRHDYAEQRAELILDQAREVGELC